MEPLIIKFKTLAGVEMQYQLTPLLRREAAEVFHNTVQVLLGAVASLSEDAESSVSLLTAIKSLDFKTFWSLAEKLFRNCVVMGPPGIGYVEIRDLNTTDYFADKPDELYVATYHAVQANWPDFFGRVAKALGGFDLGALAAQSTSTASKDTK